MALSDGKGCHAEAIGKIFTLGASLCPSTRVTASGGSPKAIDEPHLTHVRP